MSNRITYDLRQEAMIRVTKYDETFLSNGTAAGLLLTMRTIDILACRLAC